MRGDFDQLGGWAECGSVGILLGGYSSCCFYLRPNLLTNMFLNWVDRGQHTEARQVNRNVCCGQMVCQIEKELNEELWDCSSGEEGKFTYIEELMELDLVGHSGLGSNLGSRKPNENVLLYSRAVQKQSDKLLEV